ncbi:MAG: LamG domain-containing protein, partial [Planctomycetota bacterium]
IVDWADVAIMSDQWLRSDLDLNPVANPGDANLVGHWELDGDANDSSVYANHGTLIGDTAWIAGRIGSGAIEFFDGEILVPDGNATPELRPSDEVTAATWAYYSTGQDNASRVVVKGADNAETYGIEIDNDDQFVSYVRDVNGNRYNNDTDAIYRNEWMHLAVTYDGNSLKSYRNGEEVGSQDDPNLSNLSLSQDTAGFAIGDRSDANDRRFEGKVDDVRVYNRALTAGEVGWLASDGSGEVLLDSEANFHDGESPEVINIRDLGVLLLTWGEEKLWPE